jgi:hypothetical protein
MTLNVGGTPPDGQDPLTVTEIRFYYELVSEINIDYDDSEFNIISRGMNMTIDSSGDLELKARDEDLHLYANDDVRFTTNWDNNGTEYSWRMSEIGRFELPGDGYIENPENSSSDDGSSDTIKIVPDADLIERQYHEDQYLIIDPTGPNHIHIRAGGEIDSSSADLILGGERNQVLVSDTNREVKIGTASQETINTYLNTNTENSTSFITSMSADISYGARVNIDGLDFTVDSITGDTPSAGLMTVSAGGATFTAGQTYTFVFDGNGDNEWTFGSDGYLYGPVNGNLGVASIYGLPNTPLEVDSQHSVVLKGYNGEYLNGISSENQIATIGDLQSVGTADFVFDTVEDPDYESTMTVTNNDMVIKTVVDTEASGNIRIESPQNIVLNAGGDSYIGDTGSQDNRIATIGDINTAVTPVDTDFTVEGGTLGTQPTFNGAPLFTGSYVKAGAMVHFRVDVEFDNILTFGTGQYYINLPFTPKYNYMFTGGCLHDASTGITYVITGHVFAGNPQMRLESTDNSGNTSYNIPFTYNHPITLATADNFHLYGDFIVDPEAP